MTFWKKLFGAKTMPNEERYINELNDPRKRSATVSELVKTRDPAGARAIVTVLLGKQESSPSYVVFVTEAIQALGELRDPFAVPLLVDILDARFETLRKCAANALGEIGHQAAVPPLRKALMQDTSWAVRASAAGALGKLGDPTAMPALFEATSDQNQIVRYEAQNALQKIKSATP